MSITEGLVSKPHLDESNEGSDSGGNGGADGEGQKDLSRAVSVASNNGYVTYSRVSFDDGKLF